MWYNSDCHDLRGLLFKRPAQSLQPNKSVVFQAPVLNCVNPAVVADLQVMQFQYGRSTFAGRHMRTCPKCGETKPYSEFHKNRNRKDGCHSYCKSCVKKYHDEKNTILSARAYEWNRKHPERFREIIKRYYHNHPDKVKKYNKKEWQRYYATHREQIREYRRIYYQNNKEKILKKTSEWNIANRDKRVEITQRRRARKYNTQIEVIDRGKVFRRDEGICHICGKQVDPMIWHLDHIIPLVAGGTHTYDNVAVSHPVCNMRKGQRS